MSLSTFVSCTGSGRAGAVDVVCGSSVSGEATGTDSPDVAGCGVIYVCRRGRIYSGDEIGRMGGGDGRV